MGGTPRVVVVTRPTDYEALIARHGTRSQASFFLERHDQSIDVVEHEHRHYERVLTRVSQAIPTKWRRTRVPRAELSGFVFEPEDVVVPVGQDGLVPNVAKYLSGQIVVGVSPDPKRYGGVLVRHSPDAIDELLQRAVVGRVEIEPRTMVEARLDDGQHILALNEVFVGQRTHQSARYRIGSAQRTERQSSSGIIVTTGTGATGWALSIERQRRVDIALPAPSDPWLAFLVREAWPSAATGTDLTDGRIDERTPFEITSEMNEGGVVFGDGIEADHLVFGWGVRARIAVASQRLHLAIA